MNDALKATDSPLMLSAKTLNELVLEGLNVFPSRVGDFNPLGCDVALRP